MSDQFSIDASDLSRLATDLGAIADDAHENIRVAVEQTAQQVKTGWNDRLYRRGHAKHTGRGAVTYDITEGVLGVAADIGPLRGKKQAGIVSLLENGSVNNAPHRGGTDALDEALPDFEDRLLFGLWDGRRDHGFS